ncbi:hypothetical protein EVAR_43447_1 [Eumeta japonica]|uniref:Uncharacterized protein n=1 Tax=Eumeta variegata TaxID=151549 RepID=A0A4C1Y8W9_EUMVA|nr:hypothetical protein EVAR_43447_1 [Eumeta japonica]
MEIPCTATTGPTVSCAYDVPWWCLCGDTTVEIQQLVPGGTIPRSVTPDVLEIDRPNRPHGETEYEGGPTTTKTTEPMECFAAPQKSSVSQLLSH